ncbi:MAG: short chain dehydrogenase [Spirochaetota bacterium]
MKRIVLIGATGTIGRAVNEAFKAKGHEVNPFSRSTSPAIDLMNSDSIEQAFVQTGPVDAIVCTTGGAHFGSLQTSPEETFKLGLENKLMGQIRLARIGLKYLKPNGVIVLTSGLLAHYPGPGTSPVAMANAALETFVRAASLEFNDHRIVAVSPPMVKETAIALGKNIESATPATDVASAYIVAVEGSDSGKTYFVNGHSPKASDMRPLAATGHLFLQTKNAGSAAKRLVSVGVRTIMIREDFAVLELRGGTHIVVRENTEEGTSDASFDLMYDDIAIAHELYRNHGFEVTAIKEGKIHNSFYAIAPEGFRIQVLDSHAGTRTV